MTQVKDRQQKTDNLPAGSPVLAILGTNSDEPIDWIKVGLALGCMLLFASSENIWSSFLNQPIEVPELRSRVVRDVIKKQGFPQLLIRMGYGQEIKPTPRRPVDEVIRN